MSYKDSQIQQRIYQAINNFRKNCNNPYPARIILGWLDYNELFYSIDFNGFRIDHRLDGSYLYGLKITKSNRPRYIRILPKKLTYNKIKKWYIDWADANSFKNKYFPVWNDKLEQTHVYSSSCKFTM